MNKFYWNIGRIINKIKDKCYNPCELLSDYCSYVYGNSYKFSRENISIMRNFYLCYPIYIDSYDKISWNHFKKLLTINNIKVRNFYLSIILFCDSSIDELDYFISSSLYQRI